MDWLGMIGYLCWPVVFLVGHRVGGKPVPPALEAPPSGSEDKRFLVVARTASGSRAKQMFERASVGATEVIELWDGPTCRGRKGPTEG